MLLCCLFCNLAAQKHLLKFTISEETPSKRTLSTHGWYTSVHLYTFVLAFDCLLVFVLSFSGIICSRGLNFSTFVINQATHSY